MKEHGNMKNRQWISVIIPVYNTEKYLDECVSSVVGQTYESLQIILVDDGSTDRCGHICDAWVKKDPRVQVIHQKNAGVSAARNAGLKVAHGELISFVDSDDILPADAYEQLLDSWKHADLVMGRMELMMEDGTRSGECQTIPLNGYPLEAFLQELFQEKQFGYLGFLCDKLMKRSIIQDNRIVFDASVKLNEDRLFLLEYLLHCNSISFCDKVVYYYRQRGEGVITSTRRNRTVTDSEMTVVDSFRKMAATAKVHSEDLYNAVARKAFESSLDLFSRVASEDTDKVKTILSFMREYARIAMRAPGLSLIERLKIAGHCILKR